MDNGSEVIAKLPCPAAGPQYYTTASEVATRKFVSYNFRRYPRMSALTFIDKLLDVLKVPTPRILTWSAKSDNPVGAEYILEERAPGERLGNSWYQWPMDSKFGIISEIVEIERRLACTTFNQSGCIYFETDIPTGEMISTAQELSSSKTDRYRLGPHVADKLWRDDSGSSSPDRGPCKWSLCFYQSCINASKSADSTPFAFVEAMAKNEMSYVEQHANPRLNYYRSTTEPERPSEATSLLERYLKIANAMIPVHDPETSKHVTLSTLWHPDLHLDNVFVDPNSKKLTSIIDWQWTAVLPLYYQSGIPRAFESPGPVLDGAQLSQLPRDYATLPQEERTRIDVMRQSEACQKFYEIETSFKNPRHWAALQLDNLDLRRRPTRLALGLWDSKNLFFFRKALMEIKEQWTELCPDSGQCPINFSKEELDLHVYEEENQQGIGGVLKLFKDRWSLSTDGMVDPADFAQTKAAIDEYRKVFLESADDEAEKALFAKLWPYQDADS